MPNFRMLLSYDGARYQGWQRQGNTKNTIQGKLEHVLGLMCGKETEVIGAGRTDAGVHAKGMVANAWLETEMSCEEIRDYMNRYLPDDIAVREVREESGIEKVIPLSEEIFSLEILTVDGHEKKGIYVPSHLHLNVTYLLQADDGAALSVKPDENSGVAWFTPDGAVEASTEPWFRARIYGKLNRKLEAWKALRRPV